MFSNLPKVGAKRHRQQIKYKKAIISWIFQKNVSIFMKQILTSFGAFLA